MKKKRIILLISMMFLIIIGVLIYLELFKKNTKSQEILNINKVVVVQDTDITVASDFYIKTNEKGFTIFNFEEQKLYEYVEEVKYYELFNNNYIVISNDNQMIVIDKNGKVITNGKDYIQVYNTNSTENYIIIDDKLYDENMKEVYKLPEDFSSSYVSGNLYQCSIINNVLVLTFEDKNNNILVNLNTKEEMFSKFDEYLTFSEQNIEYIALKYGDKYNIINIKTNKVELDDVLIDNKFNIKKDSETMYIYDNKIYKNNTKIGKKYHMNTNGCEVGAKLLDEKNNIIIDKCMFYYEELFKNVIAGSNDTEGILYLNNNLLVANTVSKVGNYIVTYKFTDEGNSISKYKIYNGKGEELNIDDELYYLENNLYQLYNRKNQSFSLLDNKLNVISDNLNFITCSFNNYCSVTDEEGNKLLYKNGKKITTNKYEDINITKDNIIARTLFNTYIYIYGNKDEINIDTKEELNINEDEIIEKYALKNIQSKIKENNELFKKYAYIVENNNNLLDYKKQVMDMFEVVVDNKKYLNELSLLSKLKQLNITYVDNLDPGVGATYSDIDTKIELKEKDNYTLYHELMHFIDFSFNNDNNMYNIYKCGDKYEVNKGFDNNCEMINIDSNFITEAGAETYSGKYFTHELESYTPAPLILEGIEYIYGTEELKDWYFKSDSYFKKIWLDIGYTYDDTVKIIADLSSKTKIMYSGDDNTISIVDALIDLYKYKKSSDFINDNKFKYILRCLIEFRKDFTTSKYSQELNTIINENDIIIKELNSKLSDYVFYKELGDFIIIDNKEYISVLCYKGTETGSLLISYDFDNNKVLDYQYTIKN